MMTKQLLDWRRRALLCGTAVVASSALLAAADTAFAQSQGEPQAAEEIEQIIVTGSRIARPELTAPSPVTVLEGGEVDTRGVLRVEDLINTLPQAFAAQGSNISNGATGTATVNLRGLGASRTLVLVDGRRLPFGSPTSVPADLNQIPPQLIERIDVLTGGASAVYGADAVAGVVNFIMKRDFEGVQFDFQGSFFQAGNNNKKVEKVLADFNQPDPGSVVDGRAFDFNVIIGGNFDDDKGNVTAWFGYREVNPVLQANRDISACAFGTRNNGTEFSCLGSSSAFPGRFTDFGLGAGFNLTIDKDTGKLRNFDFSRDTFNFAPFNYFQRPDERYTFGAFAHYEIHPKVEMFVDLSFMDDRTIAQIAPSANFFVTDRINCDNPLLSAEQLAVFCAPDNLVTDEDGNVILNEDGVPYGILFIGRRNVEGGPRRDDLRHTNYRVVGGFRGDAFRDVRYEVFGQVSNVGFSEVFLNDLSTRKIKQAIDVVLDKDGNPVCRAALTGEAPDCVPWNIFQLGGVTQDAINFINTPALNKGDVNQLIFGASLVGDMTSYGLVSPWAATGIQLVGGFEYRKDKLELTPDETFKTGDLAGQGGPTPAVGGLIEVYEFYGEIQAPIVQDQPFFHEFAVNGAYRFSDYTLTTGTQSTYALGATWSPVPDIRTRGQFQRATRSPNPIELFSPQSIGLFDMVSGPNGLFDPCAGDFDPATTTPEPARSFEECARTGVTPEQFGKIADNPAGQFNALFGGNPELDVEKANTWTAGVVITPRQVPGLTLQVDWFSIKVKGFIGTIDPNITLNACLDSGAPFFCNLIHRGPGGQLFVGDNTFIEATNFNTGSLSTKGVDINLTYDADLADWGLDNAGSLRFHYIATWLDKLVTVPVPSELQEFVPEDARRFDCVGFYGSSCGTPNPAYRHRFSTTWRSPWELDVTVTWRFFDSVKLFGGGAPINEKFPTRNYFDLSFQYPIRDNIELRGGVNNLFDQDPPLSSVVGAGAGNGNTYPQVYDALGRFFHAGITVTF